MRVEEGSEIKVFDGKCGEWSCQISYLGSRSNCTGSVCHTQLTTDLKNISAGIMLDQIREQTKETDLWLMFAPVKGSAQDYIIQKATELGGIDCVG